MIEGSHCQSQISQFARLYFINCDKTNHLKIEKNVLSDLKFLLLLKICDKKI